MIEIKNGSIFLTIEGISKEVNDPVLLGLTLLDIAEQGIELKINSCEADNIKTNGKTIGI